MDAYNLIDTLKWSESFWMVVALPILILLAPRFNRYIISLLLKLRRGTERRELQGLVAEYRKELTKISQVNEFAKYSKLERKLRTANDQLSSIAREDLELNFKYALVAQAAAWFLAAILCLRLVYHFLMAIAYQVGLVSYV